MSPRARIAVCGGNAKRGTPTAPSSHSACSGCPYCANRKVLPGFNDLSTVQPPVAKEWHESLNGALTPEMVTAGNHKKVW